MKNGLRVQNSDSFMSYFLYGCIWPGMIMALALGTMAPLRGKALFLSSPLLTELLPLPLEMLIVIVEQFAKAFHTSARLLFNKHALACFFFCSARYCRRRVCVKYCGL